KRVGTGRAGSHWPPGLYQRIVTARSAMLELATATRLPNWTISGSFWNWGAPPDSVIAVAIATAPSTPELRVAANVPNQSAFVGGPASVAIARKTASEMTATNA